MGRGYPGLATGARGEEERMDDREAGSYSTPPEAAPGEAEGQAARDRLGTGFPALFGSVFIAFVVVAVIVLGAKYVF